MNKFLFSLLLVFALTACTTPPKSEAVRLVTGTFQSETLGLALLLEFNFAMPFSDSVPITVKGPDGWNGGAAAQFELPFLNAQGKARRILTSNAPPVLGTYTVMIDLEPPIVLRQELRSKDALTRPKNLQASSGVFFVNVRWDEVEGAVLYQARSFEKDASGNTQLFGEVYTTLTEETLPGLSREGVEQQVDVLAYDYPVLNAETPLPSNIKVSLSERVEVTPPNSTP